MTRPLSVLIALALLLTAVTAAAATPKLEKRVDNATAVLEQLTRIPEKGIPPNLLKNAYGVAVIPGVIKAGFIFGGRFGQGILVVRRPDGSWSNPSFVNLGGGSVGFQAGAQSSDIVLVFKTKRSVDNITKGKITLGGDISVAAGPWGRYTSASTDIALKSEIFSYARNRGLFGGVALDGSVLSIDKKSNAAYYQNGSGSAAQIFADAAIPTPARARHFQEALAAVAPPLNREPAARTASAAKPSQAQEGTKTYGLDDAPAVEGDVVF